MSLTIHQSGIDAAINAQASGFAGVTLNRVDLYNGSSKIKPLTLKGVQVIEPSRIYVVAQDSTTDVYDVTKMQFYTDGGVLFATAQNDDGSTIQSKAANATLLLAHQLNLSANPGTVAPSGNVSIYAPQATESLLGTAEIATQSEANGSTDDTRIITPKKLHNRTATESRRGIAEVATQTETNAGTDDSRLVTPKKLKAWWDGVRSWGNITGKPSVYPPAAHNHTIANVDGLQTALDEGTRQATESQRGQAEIATQAEVNAGTDHQRMVTPKTLKSRLSSFVRNATESISGFIKIGTQDEINSGSSGNVAVTPSKMRFGFVASLSGHIGYIIFPKWLGGFILQWGRHSFQTSGNTTQSHSFPVTFPNQCMNVIIGDWNNSDNTESSVRLRSSTTNSRLDVHCKSASLGSTAFSYLAIGF
ncbi:gp53-like domain-containing protein [Endozoicomonas euniceicola]|uniref:Putative tail fiber protein gp53-like C-terminal domain-containing protein n=1 Tax=Endozoicomonas euniceicola TaxID=1234143 RepID=A0ABY6GNE5_9GAMM|nr:hypothetical protein [Endozoicomonas euniceicola]UYM14253.1 hypothetical protein NX720_15250 [Endozoicomonas euniceicola]